MGFLIDGVGELSKLIPDNFENDRVLHPTLQNVGSRARSERNNIIDSTKSHLCIRRSGLETFRFAGLRYLFKFARQFRRAVSMRANRSPCPCNPRFSGRIEAKQRASTVS